MPDEYKCARGAPNLDSQYSVLLFLDCKTHDLATFAIGQPLRKFAGVHITCNTAHSMPIIELLYVGIGSSERADQCAKGQARDANQMSG